MLALLKEMGLGLRLDLSPLQRQPERREGRKPARHRGASLLADVPADGTVVEHRVVRLYLLSLERHAAPCAGGASFEGHVVLRVCAAHHHRLRWGRLPVLEVRIAHSRVASVRYCARRVIGRAPETSVALRAVRRSHAREAARRENWRRGLEASARWQHHRPPQRADLGPAGLLLPSRIRIWVTDPLRNRGLGDLRPFHHAASVGAGLHLGSNVRDDIRGDDFERRRERGGRRRRARVVNKNALVVAVVA
mmetsp:Transcript_15331/g.49365  ORF Transcript_15331/g.49365 Transcript_15331/m.49365 type:complete len:250 (-) Transcript_15331:498-1247(-)